MTMRFATGMIIKKAEYGERKCAPFKTLMFWIARKKKR